MARIRTIKPEFWADEKLGPLPPLERLVFLGLVSQADDAGRLVDSVRLLDGLLFGQTDDSCAVALDTLSSVGVIQRGTTASGQRVIQIVGWSKHQKVDKPSRRGILPEIQGDEGGRNDAIPEHVRKPSPEPRDTLATPSRYEVDLGAVDLGPRTGDRGPSREDDSPAPPVQSAGQVEFLEQHPDVRDFLNGIRHGGGIKATAATLEHRFLYPDGQGDLGDPIVKGLPLAERKRLVLAALLEYATSGEAFERPFFTGYVKRIKDAEAREAVGIRPRLEQLPPEPEISEAERAEGARILSETMAKLRPGPRGPEAAA